MMLKQPVFILLLVLLSAFAGQINKPRVIKWVVQKGGSLQVNGSTNINKFNCVISNYAQPDTITIHKNSAKKALSLSGSINLDVQNFNCHHPIMTSDLRKTLKAKQYPHLTIKFLSLNQYPDLSVHQNQIKGQVAIELAGVAKQFEVNYKVISLSSDVINLIGTRQVNFSDFKIIPPRKIGGMIQTNNELDVVFNLRMKIID